MLKQVPRIPLQEARIQYGVIIPDKLSPKRDESISGELQEKENEGEEKQQGVRQMLEKLA